MKAYIGLGSNINPLLHIGKTLHSLRHVPGIRVTAISSLYQSRPAGPVPNQADFINAVIELLVYHSPMELLYCLQAIETQQGRQRNTERPQGPRTLDLDLLLFGQHTIQTAALQIPHPRLSQREFVVYPLAEIAPLLVLPDGTAVAALQAACPLRGMTVLSPKQSEDAQWLL